MRHEALLWEALDDRKVHCRLCPHNCVIEAGEFGFCGMRQNIDGELFTFAYGTVIANHVDPIEKKPLYHFLPGSLAYSIATIGCNFRCSFCQNWSISQMSVKDGDAEGYILSPEDVVREALGSGCKSISYTYTEPTVFFEYAHDTAMEAKSKGLFNTFVTNGYMTKDTVRIASEFLDAANIDLKFFKDSSYREICGGSLDPVLETIVGLKNNGVWVEVTTLIVPGKNDSEEELKGIAGFLSDAGDDIPWHINRFHPDYKYKDNEPTPLSTMQRAMVIGKEAGLKYVYLGNVLESGNTVCPGCGAVVIERTGFGSKAASGFLDTGRCLECGKNIEGIWK